MLYHTNMAKLGYAAALQQLEKGELDPAYLLIGDNYYQRFLLTEMILSNRIPAGQRAYNKFEIAGQKASAQTLEDSLCTVPLLGGNIVVVVTEISRVPAKSQAFLSKALGRLDPTVTFIGSANKLDMRKSFAKNLAKQCTVVELKELSNRVLPGYIRSRFAARGLAVDEKGIIEFCRVVGRDCGEIENEAEKISILFADRKSLGYEDIRDYLSRSRHFSRYEAAEYLAHRQLGGALTSLQKVLAVGGGEARGMIWAYYQQLERMLLYKRLADTIKPDDLAGRLRMPVFLLKQLAQQASKWTDDQLLQALAQVYQCEVGQRFTPQPREHIWERALIRMIGEKRE